MKRLLIGVLILHVFFCVYTWSVYGGPPVRAEEETSPDEYMEVNRFVREKRYALAEKGILSSSFFPRAIHGPDMIEYLYWYSCAIVGDPNYAITVTIRYPSPEDYETEKIRLMGTKDVTQIVINDVLMLCKQSVPEKVAGFFEDPVYDGTEYIMEYAFIKESECTITYSEVDIWENQIIHKTVRQQLEWIYENTKTMDKGITGFNKSPKLGSILKADFKNSFKLRILDGTSAFAATHYAARGLILSSMVS